MVVVTNDFLSKLFTGSWSFQLPCNKHAYFKTSKEWNQKKVETKAEKDEEEENKMPLW